MKGLFVIGTGGSGKTALCVAMAQRLTDSGAKVGYFKPIGNVSGTTLKYDRDAVLMKELLGMESEIECIVPYHTSPSYLSRYTTGEAMLAKVKECFQLISRTVDYVLVEGTTSPQAMMALGLDAPSLAKQLGLPAIVVSKGENDYHLDETLLSLRYIKSLGTLPAGVIFNNVSKQNLDKCRGVYAPLVEAEGYPVIGVIPKSSELVAPTVREIVEVLGGQLLEGADHLDHHVEEVMIGAMTPESALSYFHRSINKAVVVGGDRPAVALAALETNTAVLILTGGIYPDKRVLTRAAERNVPVLLVPDNTFDAVEKLHFVSRKFQATDTKAIDEARKHLEQFCDLTAINQLFGI